MKLYSLVIALLLCNISIFEKCASLDPDVNRNVSELISSKGYPVEEYEVQTEDGYILGVQRIPHGKHQQKKTNCKREVVFLQHGIFCDSSAFVTDFPGQSLGFTLADSGYDVWFGNDRGTPYSKKHINLTTDMKEFWDFSFDEHAALDLPAMIDFVLNKTKQEQLVYIGHSQGTLSMFALLSQSPEYNQKVKLFIALGPAVTLQYITSILRIIVLFVEEISPILKLFGSYNFALPSFFMKYLEAGACNAELKPLCELTFSLLYGRDPQQLNDTRLSVYSTRFFLDTSLQNIEHLGQVIRTGKFRKYDYGLIENMRHYNQATPPMYDITKITTPVVLMSGMNDAISVPKQVQEIAKNLPSLKLNYRVPFKAFTHVDFLVAIDAYKLFHQKILDLLCEVSQ